MPTIQRTPLLRCCGILLLLTAPWYVTAAPPDSPPADSSALGSWSLTSLEVADIRVGIAGHYKVGRWTPVRFDVQNGPKLQSGHWQLWTRDDVGERCLYVDSQMSVLAANQALSVTRYVRFGRLQNELRIRWVPNTDAVEPTSSIAGSPASRDAAEGGARPAAQTREWSAPVLPPAARATQQAVAVFGERLDWSSSAALLSRHVASPLVIVSVENAADLPTTSWGWDGFDLVVPTGGDSRFLATVTDMQWKALWDWTHLGGRLLVATGSEARALVGDGGVLQPLAPGPYASTQGQFETTAIEGFAGAQERLDLLVERGGDQQDGGLLVARFGSYAGATEVTETVAGTRVPLVIRKPWGLGQVVFVAFDLDREPLTQWNGYARLISRLLKLAAITTLDNEPQETAGQLSHLGFQDIAGQLRAALENYAGTQLIPFGVIAVLALAYVLWIGPGEYFTLRQLGGRYRVTWLTFPLAVLLATGLALFLAHQSRGRAAQSNQLDIVDYDVATGLVRGTSWYHLYTPTTNQYDVAYGIPPAWNQAETPTGQLFGWQGLAGSSFGGMDNTSVQAGRQPAYRVTTSWHAAPPAIPPPAIPAPNSPAPNSPAAAVPEVSGAANLILSPGASRAFRGQWWQRGASTSQVLRATSAGFIDSPVRNSLPLTLRQAKLLYGRWYYELGDFPPGATRTINDTLSPRSLRNWLARREVVEGKDFVTPWDQASLDVPRIVEMLMFHERAGGSVYTGLTHRHLPWLDLSDQLTAGRAILIGQLDPAGATSWTASPRRPREQQHQAWAYARIVLPVTIQDHDSR